MRFFLSVVLSLVPAFWSASPAPGATSERTSSAGRPLVSAESEAAAVASSDLRKGALRVFLDCDRRCDFDFLRRQVAYVNYVRDPRDAQVQVVVTARGAGAGLEQTLSFVGLGELEGVDVQLTLTTSQTDTSDEVRRAFARVLQLGLVRYVLETPLADQLEVRFRENQDRPASTVRAEDDPWNFWVYRARARASLSGEDRRDNQSYSGSITARRTTEEWRTSLGVNGAYNESSFVFDDGSQFDDVARDVGAGGQVIKTVSEHWGVGAGASARQSTFLNLDLSYRAAGAVEYNLFPYSESSERELTFTYFLGLSQLEFEEMTLFGVAEDTVADQGAIVSFDMEQPWGETGVDFEMAHFLDDTDKYRAVLRGRIEYRIFRGLSVNLSGSASLVRDQIFLPATGASDEDILLARRALDTDSRFHVGFGLTYTFGSIYNNIVNSRFTGSSGGFHRIF